MGQKCTKTPVPTREVSRVGSPNAELSTPGADGGGGGHMQRGGLPGTRPTVVGLAAPDFKAMAVMGDGTFKELSLSEDYAGRSVVLLFYPLDFTFVCPTELVALDRRYDEFVTRGIDIVACSVNSHFSHHAWRETEIKDGGIGPVKFPILADVTKDIMDAYDVVHSTGVALRGLFVIDSTHTVRHALVNDLALGRSVDEVLRIVDAIQHHEQSGEVCPADWMKGDAAVKPSAEGIAEYLSEKFGDTAGV